MQCYTRKINVQCFQMDTLFSKLFFIIVLLTLKHNFFSTELPIWCQLCPIISERVFWTMRGSAWRNDLNPISYENGNLRETLFCVVDFFAHLFIPNIFIINPSRFVWFKQTYGKKSILYTHMYTSRSKE